VRSCDVERAFPINFGVQHELAVRR
jgi:hypothetical protein